MRIHIIGIGGAGMSAIARLLLAEGHQVSGSDARASEATARLAGLGATVRVGHDASHVVGADLVFASAAIPDQNPELRQARALGLPIQWKADALRHFGVGRRVVAVSGTHGKTTTTSMVGLCLVEAGFDPLVWVGGDVPEFGGNARSGRGPFAVFEADESDRTFLRLEPTFPVVTNVEPDHLDQYGSYEAIVAAFAEFVGQVPPDGAAVVCLDDPGVRRLLGHVTTRPVTYGLRSPAEWTATEVELEPDGTSFQVRREGRYMGRIALRLSGLHNVLNALAAIAVSLACGASLASVARGLAAFGGAGRRFETVGRAGGVHVVSDYAHHPTEVRATIEAARQRRPERVIALFQPHLYSRTRDHAAAFGRALAEADLVALGGIYAAREAPLPGVTSQLLAEACALAGAPTPPVFDDLDRMAEWVAGRARPGDLVLVMGAGDINRIGPEILARLAARSTLLAGPFGEGGASR